MWRQAAHEYLVKQLLGSPAFHRFVRYTNAKMKGEPVPPPAPEYLKSRLNVRMNKIRVFNRLFKEEFKKQFTR